MMSVLKNRLSEKVEVKVTFSEMKEFSWIQSSLFISSYEWFTIKSVHIHLNKWGPLSPVLQKSSKKWDLNMPISHFCRSDCHSSFTPKTVPKCEEMSGVLTLLVRKKSLWASESHWTQQNSSVTRCFSTCSVFCITWYIKNHHKHQLSFSTLRTWQTKSNKSFS